MHAEQRALAIRVRVYRPTHAPHQIPDFEAKRAGASVTTRIRLVEIFDDLGITSHATHSCC
jgi:hypothetical protein